MAGVTRRADLLIAAIGRAGADFFGEGFLAAFFLAGTFFFCTGAVAGSSPSPAGFCIAVPSLIGSVDVVATG